MGALADSFSRALPSSLTARFVVPELESVLEGLIRTARDAWPQLENDEHAFVDHLAQRLTAESTLQGVHAADLWLAFACVMGEPQALELFDRQHLSRVPGALRGSLPAGMTDDDVLQGLRLRLFVRREGVLGIAGYSGRGALVHWLRAGALRVTQDFARGRKLEVSTSDEALVDSPLVRDDLDVAYVKQRYAPEFKLAFQEALAELPSKDQNLLRLQYLDGVSPDEIGRLYQTHRTTVWRWLTQCRESLFTRTRRKLAARLNLPETEFSSLMNAVQSQLDVSLNRLLAPKPRE